MIDASGVKNGNDIKYALNLQMQTSLEITGMVAAEIARQAISSNRPNGIYWSHELLPIDFMKRSI